MAKKRRVFFLLRSYNDIDHIAPIIWKALHSNIVCFYLFTDQARDTDYRIQFLDQHGAIRLHAPVLDFYHRVRKGIRPRVLRRTIDYLISFSVGTWYLISKDIYCIVNEWSGPFGREMAEYFLRPGRMLKLKTICVPHGYHFWTNKVINVVVKEYVDRYGTLPNFSNRAQYTAYVVQTNNIRDYYLAHGMPANKLRVLGSARFCPEWRNTLIDFLPKQPIHRSPEHSFTVVIFIPDWTYFIDRQATVSLINALSSLSGVLLLIKQNTRGTGSIDFDELESSAASKHIHIVGDELHSPSLVAQADCLINFASSIGLEGLGQGKPVINPTYLNGNQTIFDESGAVIDASSETEVIQSVQQLQNKSIDQLPSPDTIDRFLHAHVNAERPADSVLQGYVDLITA